MTYISFLLLEYFYKKRHIGFYAIELYVGTIEERIDRVVYGCTCIGFIGSE